MAKSKSLGGMPLSCFETGRYENIPAEERFCPFCPGVVENEIHVLMSCTLIFMLIYVTIYVLVILILSICVTKKSIA